MAIGELIRAKTQLPPRGRTGGIIPFVHMGEDSLNQPWLLDAGDSPELGG
ncbi:MAG: hypothetical protein OEQ16_06755 [Gammaproteobacteria bacterium]|jgi:hypothetical protein|nr:hypothetical protein [Gammaproteobacteria bacterium]